VSIFWRFLLWLTCLHALLLMVFFMFGLFIRVQENQVYTHEKERIEYALQRVLSTQLATPAEADTVIWFEVENEHLVAIRESAGQLERSPFEPSWLDDWERIIGAQLTLQMGKSGSHIPDRSSREGPWSFPLNGSLGVPVARIEAYPNSEAWNIQKSVSAALHRMMLIALLADGIAVLGLVYGMFIHPVVRIRKSLDQQSDEYVEQLTRERGEHGKIARMIKSFFQQQKELERREAQLSESIREREQISRDLHDDLIQQLYALGLKLEAMQVQTSRGELELSSWSRLRLVLNRLIEQVRGYIQSPAYSAELVPMKKDLEASCRHLSERFGCVLHLEYQGQDLYPNEVTRRELSAILSEAVSNAVRHGKADDVRVRVHVSGEDVIMEMVDSGAGFEVEKTKRGMGLNNIEFRSNAIGAHWEFESSAGQGTVIRLRWKIV
jgi:signal transduction histidine kinase